MNKSLMVISKLISTGILAALATMSAWADDLTVTGNLNITSNLTVQQSLSLGGVPRSTWPSGGAGTFVDLGSNPTLDATGSLYSIILTNHATWDFGSHTAGRVFELMIAQDTTGGWTNAWSSDVFWPGGVLPTGLLLQ